MVKTVEKRKRMTRQKKVIYEILQNTKSHPTADWIYEQARKVLPDISLGTVYRNLQVLMAENKIQELNYGKSYSRFDGNPKNHYHFVCDLCGEVSDFEPSEPILREDALDFVPGKPRTYRLEFYGTCSKCCNK